MKKSYILLVALFLSVVAVQSPFFKESFAKSYTRSKFSKALKIAIPNAKPPTATPTPVPTPTIGPIGQITKKVLVLNFDPLINGTTPLHTYKNWNDPVGLQNQYVLDVKNSSYQYVNYQIVNTQVIHDYPVKTGGFKFTQAQYLGCLTDNTPSYCSQMIDYNKLLADYNVCSQVNNGAVDELWLWGAPYFGYYEAVMAGPGAFHTNGPVVLNTTCNKKLDIMGFNYERGVIEMIHDLGHRVEGVFYKTFGGTSFYSLTNTPNMSIVSDRFTVYDKKLSGKSGCGNVHFPVNGAIDYDYTNQTSVVNRCDDWLNYPSTKGATQFNNCSVFNCNQYDYFKYWFSRIPHTIGSTNEKLNNWWSYIVDYDNAVLKETQENKRWYFIENSSGDTYTSCGQNFSTNDNVYLGVNPSCTSSNNHIASLSFPNVNIPKNSQILDAYLEFVADGPYSNNLTQNIVATDGVYQSSPFSWNINQAWNYNTITKTPSFTSQVQELINSSSWNSGKTLTLKISHVSGVGERRFFGFDREAMAGARLVINTTSQPAPSPTPISGQKTLTITSGVDDYNFNCDQTIDSSSTSVKIGYRPTCASQQKHIARFTFKNVSIPKYSTFSKAQLIFNSVENYTSPMPLVISLTASGLSVSYEWTLDSWYKGVDSYSPELVTSLKYLLDNSAWSGVGDITVTLSAKDPVSLAERLITSYEANPAKSARFVLNYQTPVTTPQPSPTPVFTSCADIFVTSTTTDNTAQSWNGTSCIPQDSQGYLRFGITNNSGQNLPVSNVRIVWNDDKGHYCGADKSLSIVSGTLANQSFYQSPPNLTRNAMYGVSLNTNVSLPTGSSTLNIVTNKYYNHIDGSECFSLYIPSRGCYVYGGYGANAYCNIAW